MSTCIHWLIPPPGDWMRAFPISNTKQSPFFLSFHLLFHLLFPNMNSPINNKSEKQDVSGPQPQSQQFFDSNKRVRLEMEMDMDIEMEMDHMEQHIEMEMDLQQNIKIQKTSPSTPLTTSKSVKAKTSLPKVNTSLKTKPNVHDQIALPSPAPSPSPCPLPIQSSLQHDIQRRFRSRSLPNIYLHHRRRSSQSRRFVGSPSAHSHSVHSVHNRVTLSHSPSPMTTTLIAPHVQIQPPVNLTSLREIDLSEILKNPQLRHDILFDPQLQFRPNLDGERGKKKKLQVDKYWDVIQQEITDLYASKLTSLNPLSSRLPSLFSTLKGILISLLPEKDKVDVGDVLDTDLLLQQLLHTKSPAPLLPLSSYLATILKHHCAPMRDAWIDEMSENFEAAVENKSVVQIVDSLRMVFAILEAMKLDIANHQIRMLRAILVETATEFERDYFDKLLLKDKSHLKDAIDWFQDKYKQSLVFKERQKIDNEQKQQQTRSYSQDHDLQFVLLDGIGDLLSCRKVVSEFPSSFVFDHTRLVLLRAEVRQVVCLQLCLTLYRQLNMIFHQGNKTVFQSQTNSEKLLELRKDILALIVDENGNIKWTRNLNNIAIQLVSKTVQTDSHDLKSSLPENLIDFSYNWLLKQTQPTSDLYKIFESRTLGGIKTLIFGDIKSKDSTSTVQGSTNKNNEKLMVMNEVLEDIILLNGKIGTLAKFHWGVFGDYYSSSVESI